MDANKKKLVGEVVFVTIILVALSSLLNYFSFTPFLNKYQSLIFALLFIYVPFAILHRQGRSLDFLDSTLQAYLKSISVFLIAAIIVFPLFFIGAHFWEKIVYSANNPGFAMIPHFWKFLANQFVMVALPEELFFRGYMQSTLNKVFPNKWKLFGANLGWAWIITALIFAVAHSFIVLRWWHFAIFFPALLFGYLREKTGTITAPILFHATSNIAITWITHLYP